MVSPLQIYVLAPSRQRLTEAAQWLPPERFMACLGLTVEDSVARLRDRNNPMDCLVAEDRLIEDGLSALVEAGIFLPLVVLSTEGGAPRPWQDLYHGGVVTLKHDHLDRLESSIHQAIQQFLAMPVDSCALPMAAAVADNTAILPELLGAQQNRLTEKRKARLGYLGVYYKRNPEHFLRNMSQVDRDALLNQLKIDYRRIVLGYFSSDAKLNQNIDTFVNQAFMADISVSIIVEMHMDLMDEFSKQLKLEGRSEEILLDYRLTLIDVIAHLCEMYRRSIPREP